MTSDESAGTQRTRHVVMNQVQIDQVKLALKSQRIMLQDAMFGTSSGKEVLDYARALLEVSRLWAQLYVNPGDRDLARDESYVMVEETKRILDDRIAEFGAD